MTWKDILKQNIPTQREHGFPVVGDIYVYDPNIGDSDKYWLTFYSNDWDNGLEARMRENSSFKRNVFDKHPNSPLVAFFNKYAKFREDPSRIEMIKEPNAQEIKSVAESMGLEIYLNVESDGWMNDTEDW